MEENTMKDEVVENNENDENERLKWYVKLIIIVLFVIFSPIMALGFVSYFFIYIVPAPIELLLYKRSKYYQAFNIKYTFGCTYQEGYYLYNAIIKNNINLKFVSQELGEWSHIETSAYILVFSWFEEIGFITQDEQWEIAETDNDEPEMLVDSMSKIIQEKIECCSKPVRIILSKAFFDKMLYERAKQEQMFFIYKNKRDLIEKLKELE